MHEKHRRRIAGSLVEVVGAQVAAALYGRACPVIAVSEADYHALVKCPQLSIRADGSISA